MSKKVSLLIGTLFSVQYALANMPDTLWSVDITNCSNETISIGGTLATADGHYSGRCWHIAYTLANDFFNVRQLPPVQSTRLYTREIGDDAGWYNDCNNNNDVEKYMYTHINNQIIGFFADYHSQTQKSIYIPVIPNKWFVKRVMVGEKNNDTDIRDIDILTENNIIAPRQPHVHLFYYGFGPTRVLAFLDQVAPKPTTEYLNSLYNKCFIHNRSFQY